VVKTGIDPVSLLGLIAIPAADYPDRTLRRQCATIMSGVAVMRGCVLGSQNRMAPAKTHGVAPMPGFKGGRSRPPQ
jgi:hypothetical protein